MKHHGSQLLLAKRVQLKCPQNAETWQQRQAKMIWGWVGGFGWRWSWSCLKLETVLKDTASAASIFNCKWKGSTFLDSLVAHPERQRWHVPGKHYSVPWHSPMRRNEWHPPAPKSSSGLNDCRGKQRSRNLSELKAVTHFIFSHCRGPPISTWHVFVCSHSVRCGPASRPHFEFVSSSSGCTWM